MGKSWELTDDQKKEIQEQQAEIGAQYDPETGRKKGETENTGDNEDVEGMEDVEDVEASRNSRERIDDDDNIR